MPAILLHALTAHPVKAWHLTALQHWRYLAAGVPNPPAQAPPGLTTPVNTILGWGKWGVLVCGVARPADLRREDGGRPPEPGHLRRRRRDRDPLGAGRAEPRRGRRRDRRGVPVIRDHCTGAGCCAAAASLLVSAGWPGLAADRDPAPAGSPATSPRAGPPAARRDGSQTPQVPHVRPGRAAVGDFTGSSCRPHAAAGPRHTARGTRRTGSPTARWARCWPR